VIPVWGAHAAYVAQAAESILAQEGAPARVLIVDNASDDPVEAPEGAEVMRLPQRVRVAAARNAGLWAATTPFVMFWDADDVMLPGALATMLEVLRGDARVVAVTMASRQWSPEDGPGEVWPWPRRIMYRLSPHRRLLALVSMVYNPFTTTGPSLMRTDAATDAGGFHEGIAFFEDWALSVALTVRGRIRMLPEVGRLYRIHGDSLSLGHLDQPEQRQWLAGIRDQIRRDHRTPWWMRVALPLAHLHHLGRIRRRVTKGKGAGFYVSALEATADGAGGGSGAEHRAPDV
jgi:glycosyltransferase involved in cell wall biosynthesis